MRPIGRTHRPDLKELFASRILVCDGAMGTMLQAAGVPLEAAHPELNLTRPELVGAVHRAYIDAGADVIETNTFGASAERLRRYGLEDRVAELNHAAVEVARAAIAASGREVLIAGSVSPATPPSSRNRLASSLVQEAFRGQIEALAESGVDFLLFETFGSLDELSEAISVARLVDSALPVVAQMTFLDDGNTLAGERPEEVARKLGSLDLLALGANCTLGPQGLLDVLQELAQYASLPLTVQPNAGSPSFIDGHFQYTADPASFARFAARYANLGGVLIGGCCGTTPAHIEAVSRELRGLEPSRRSVGQLTAVLSSDSSTTVSRAGASGLIERVQAGSFVKDAFLVTPLTGAQLEATSFAVTAQEEAPDSTAILTVTAGGRSLPALQAELLGAHALGVRAILCRPGGNGASGASALPLIRLLQDLNGGRDRHGIPLARPTDFTIGAYLDLGASDRASEAVNARLAAEAGARFLVTSPVSDLGPLDGLLDAIDLPPGIPLLLAILDGAGANDDLAEMARRHPKVSGVVLSSPVGASDTGNDGALKLAEAGTEGDNEDLRLLVSIYDRLGALVLQGAEAASITVALSELVRQPVLLLDPMLKPVTLDPRSDVASVVRPSWNPTDVYRTRVLEAMAGQRRTLSLPPVPAWGVDHSCVLAPVLACDDTLGYVAILDREGASPGDAELLVAQHAASVYALALMRSRLASEVNRELREELLEGLLLGQVTDEQAARERAHRLGYEEDEAYRVLVLMPQGSDGASDGRQTSARRHLLDAAAHYVNDRRPRAIVSRRRTELVMLVPDGSETSPADFGREVSIHVASLYPAAPISIGVSSVCSSPRELARCYKQARRSAEVATRFGRRGEVLSFEDLGLYRLLFHVSDREELRAFVEQSLGPLIEYDRQHKTDFVRTIAAYLSNNNNLQSTARELGVHVNTASYRIQRIQAITGLDLTTTDDSLLARVALMILEDSDVSG